MGRPSKYLPIYCEQLVEHMRGGLSFESFAGVIGTCRATLYQWEEAHREFSDAKKHGLELNLLWWERVGRAAMLGQGAVKGPDGKPMPIKNFNATLWIFNMKNRHGWRDKQDVDMKVEVEPFVVETSDGKSTKLGVKKK